MSYGTCKQCGCTDNNACVHPDFGSCWWMNEIHNLCSHCVELADDPTVERPKDREQLETLNLKPETL